MSGQEFEATAEFYSRDEANLKVPRAGGLLIWITTIAFALIFWILLKIEPTNKTFQFLNFTSRAQTFIPLATLFFASIFGFIDDALSTMEAGGNYTAGGLKLSHRFGLITVLSFVIGLWFWLRVGINQISFFNLTIPFEYNLSLSGWMAQNFGESLTIGGGWVVVLLTMGVMLGLWGSSMIDGFDGCSAGVFIPIFLCFAGIAFARGFYDISTLVMVIVGATVAYLWYNIPPARFYMGDTGTFGLLATLGVVAILIDAVYILPIAGLMLVLTEASVIIQILSKKIFKRKVFKAAPLHHHLEAIGWLRHQVTMRYWLVSIMSSVLGLALGILLG